MDKNGKIKFNNFTTYLIADGEYLSKYFKKIYNKDESYYNQDIYYNLPLDLKKKSNYLFIKVILIEEEYIIGIEQYPKLYKIKKYKDKLNQINDIYTFVIIRNYDEQSTDDLIIITLRDDSTVLTFENTFFDSFINNLTVININYIDFNEKDNYYKEIGLKNNFYLKIAKKNDNIILNYKNGKYNYYLPYEIKLINREHIDNFKFLLYYGLWNRINCLINYKGEDKYSCEYFYYNRYTLKNLPLFKLNIGKDEYIIKNYDTFNSQIRKRYVIINIPKNDNIIFYEEQYKNKELRNQNKQNNNKLNKKENKNILNSNNINLNQKDKIQIDKNEKELNNKNNIDIIKNNNINNNININEKNYIEILDDMNQNKNDSMKDIENDNLNVQTLHDSLQFYFYYDDKNNVSNLFGIYNIEDIIEQNPEILDEKILKKYEIFFNYYNVKIGLEEPINNYLETIKNFEKDTNIANLVFNYNIFSPTISYKYYIIYINICLFYFSLFVVDEKKLIKEFKNKFETVNISNLSISQKIRILRFTCQEEYKSQTEFVKAIDILLLDSLPEDDIFKLAFNYNIKVIKNLKEQSKLYLPFLQLDNYILYNYYVNSNSYTVSMEPLIITKHHLLSLYEPFLFVSIEANEDKNLVRYACQCTNNDITMINMSGLFGDLIAKPSLRTDKNYSIPISMELFHEKNGHLKKLQKNKRKLSPIYFFKKNNVIKLPTEDQKINIRGESGRLIEHFIKYKKKSLVHKLETNFNHKDILRDFNYFTNSNFQKLYEKLGFFNDEAELSENDEENNNIKSYEFNNFDETHLEYYEKNIKNLLKKEENGITIHKTKIIIKIKYLIFCYYK